MEQIFYQCLEKDDSLAPLLDQIVLQEQEFNKINQQVQSFYDGIVNQQFNGSNKELQDCFTLYLKQQQFQPTDTVMNSQTMLKKVVQSYTERSQYEQERKFQESLKTIESIQELCHSISKLKRENKNYLSPLEAGGDRIQSLEALKTLISQIDQHQIFNQSSKLLDSARLQFDNFLKSLSYHSQLQIDQSLIICSKTGQGLIQVKINMNVLMWLRQNSKLLPLEDLFGNVQKKLNKILEEQSMNFTVETQDNNQQIQYTIEQKEEFSNNEEQMFLNLEMNPVLFADQFFQNFQSLVEGMFILLHQLDLQISYEFISKLAQIFKNKLLKLLQEGDKKNQFIQGIIESKQQSQQSNSIVAESINTFINLLDLDTYLLKHTQYSVLDSVKSSLVEFKNEMISCSNLIAEEFNQFSRNIQQGQKQGNKFKQFLISKTIGESKKNTHTIQLTPEIQNAQHVYFKTLQTQFDRIKKLQLDIYKLENPCEALQILSDHIILLNFILNDLYISIEDKGFNFFNFYVSILTQVDGQIEEFLDQLSYYLLDRNDEQILKLQTYILDFYVVYKKSLNIYARQLNKKRKLEFSSDFQ